MLENLLTSGYSFAEEEYDTKLNYILFNTMMLVDIVMLALAAGIRFYQGDNAQALLDGTFVLFSFAVLLFVRLSRSYFLPAFYLLVAVAYIVASYAFFQGKTSLGGTGWYFVLLMTVLFIRNHREGLFLFLFSVATIVLLALFARHSLSNIFVGIMPFVSAFVFITLYEKRHNHLREIIEIQKNAYAHQALFDKLTNIPNRDFFFVHFRATLERALASKQSVALLFIDMDRFKEINDTYGHQTGDEVLVEVAKRLESQLDKEDMVARFGGDEFVIITNNAAAVPDLLSQLHAMMQHPIETSLEKIDVSFSAGQALFPDDGTTETALIGHADKMMYQAKKNNRPARPVG